jgi:hypothetical protein
MPEFTVKEVRLPELHLPEIKRDEIVRALSGVHLPEVDLAKARRTTFKVPAVTLNANDVDRLIAAGSALTRFVRPTPRRVWAPWRAFGRRSAQPFALVVRPRARRSRRPFILVGLVVAGLAIWAFLRRPDARQRLEAASQDARERLATWNAQDLRPGTPEAVNRPAEASDTTTDVEGIANATDDAGVVTESARPNDLGTEGPDTDGIPAFEESQPRS